MYPPIISSVGAADAPWILNTRIKCKMATISFVWNALFCEQSLAKSPLNVDEYLYVQLHQTGLNRLVHNRPWIK